MTVGSASRLRYQTHSGNGRAIPITLASEGSTGLDPQNVAANSETNSGSPAYALARRELEIVHCRGVSALVRHPELPMAVGADYQMPAAYFRVPGEGNVDRFRF